MYVNRIGSLLIKAIPTKVPYPLGLSSHWIFFKNYTLKIEVHLKQKRKVQFQRMSLWKIVFCYQYFLPQATMRNMSLLKHAVSLWRHRLLIIPTF